MSIADMIQRLQNAKTSIADAISSKGVSTAGHGFESFANDILKIKTSGTYQSKTVPSNHAGQIITPDEGYDALTDVTVEAMPDASCVITAVKGAVENHQMQIIGRVTNLTPGFLPRGTKDGTLAVEVTASELVSGSLEITSNGTVNVANYESVDVNIPAPSPSLQEKTVTPRAAEQTVQADAGYDGLSKVTVNGDSFLVPQNIRKGVVVFGVSGTAESGAVVGSLIVVQCSTDITSVTATHGEEMQYAYMENGYAYVIIPHTFSGEVVLRGYRNEETAAATSATVVVTAIDKYTSQLLTSSPVFKNGVWYSVDNPAFTAINGPRYTEYGSGNYSREYWYSNSYFTSASNDGEKIDIKGRIYCYTATSSYSNGPRIYIGMCYLNPIDTRGFHRVRIKGGIVNAGGGMLKYRVGYIKDSVPGTNGKANPSGSGTDYTPRYFDDFLETTASTFEHVFDFDTPTDAFYLVFALDPAGFGSGTVDVEAYVSEIEFI